MSTKVEIILISVKFVLITQLITQLKNIHLFKIGTFQIDFKQPFAKEMENGEKYLNNLLKSQVQLLNYFV